MKARITYTASFDGEIDIEADSMDAAVDMLDDLSLDELYEHAWGSLSSYPVVIEVSEVKE